MRKIIGLVTAVAALLVLAIPASANNGANAVSFTQTFHDTPMSMAVGPLCGAPAGELTGTFNGVFHGTILTTGVGAGTGWFTGTQTGFFTLVPTDTSLGTYSGHITAWFGDNNNLQNGAETSTINAFATNSLTGATITVHAVEHISVSATGEMTIFFSCS
jgi:hypothetical protein